MVESKRQFGDVLRAEMKRQKLTWAALVALSGVSRSTLARILANNPEGQRLDTIEALAKALGISPGKFWGDKGRGRG